MDINNNETYFTVGDFEISHNCYKEDETIPCIHTIKHKYELTYKNEKTDEEIKIYWENKKKEEEEQKKIAEKYKASSRLEKLKEKHYSNYLVDKEEKNTININDDESFYQVGNYEISYNCYSNSNDCMNCSHKIKHNNELIYSYKFGSNIYSILKNNKLSHPHFDKYEEYYKNKQTYADQEYFKKYGKKRVLKYDKDCSEEDYIVDCSEEIVGECDNDICNCKINKKYHIFGKYNNEVNTWMPIYNYFYNIKYIDNTIPSHRLTVSSIISKFKKDNLPLPKKFDLTVSDKYNICINSIKQYFLNKQQKAETKIYWENKKKEQEEQKKIAEKYKASSRLDKLKEKHNPNYLVDKEEEENIKKAREILIEKSNEEFRNNLNELSKQVNKKLK
jgi:hypothetical protein